MFVCERECARERVCEIERARERVRVCERGIERESVCARESERERGRESNSHRMLILELDLQDFSALFQASDPCSTWVPLISTSPHPRTLQKPHA